MVGGSTGLVYNEANKRLGVGVSPTTHALEVPATAKFTKLLVNSTATSFDISIGGGGLYNAGNFYCSNMISNANSANDGTLQFVSNGSPTITRNKADALSALIVKHSNASATGDIQQWGNSSATVARITQGGNLCVHTTAAGTSAAHVIAMGAGTAPSTAPASVAQIWAEDMSGTTELRVMDSAGNVTTISPHDADGPAGIYTKVPGIEPVVGYRSIFGKITWVNLAGNAASIEETFQEYNVRRALAPGHIDLVPADWDEHERLRVEAAEADILKWESEAHEYTEAVLKWKTLPWNFRKTIPAAIRAKPSRYNAKPNPFM